MKKFWDATGFVVLIVACLGLAFLFTGDPDVWDRLHERAMASFDQRACP